jgi:hypothetical protein
VEKLCSLAPSPCMHDSFANSRELQAICHHPTYPILYFLPHLVYSISGGSGRMKEGMWRRWSEKEVRRRKETDLVGAYMMRPAVPHSLPSEGLAARPVKVLQCRHNIDGPAVRAPPRSSPAPPARRHRTPRSPGGSGRSAQMVSGTAPRVP